jgi:hypothetical protein
MLQQLEGLYEESHAVEDIEQRFSLNALRMDWEGRQEQRNF